MGTAASEWTKLLSANSTDDAFDTVVPTTTKPIAASGLAVIEWNKRGFDADLLALKFFGEDTNDDAFDARVWGWTENEGGVWEPTLLAQFAVTLGNIARGSNHFDADTLAITYGNTDLVKVSSPANDLPAYAVIDPLGSKLVSVEFDVSSAAGANGFYRRIASGSPS